MSDTDPDDPRQLESALVIGGTGFIGRHTVAELLAHDYHVTTMSRSERPIEHDDGAAVDHVAGDRADVEDLHRAARQVDPDLVVDAAAFHPGDVQSATEAFADVEADVALYEADVGRA